MASGRGQFLFLGLLLLEQIRLADAVFQVTRLIELAQHVVQAREHVVDTVQHAGFGRRKQLAHIHPQRLPFGRNLIRFLADGGGHLAVGFRRFTCRVRLPFQGGGQALEIAVSQTRHGGQTAHVAEQPGHRLAVAVGLLDHVAQEWHEALGCQRLGIELDTEIFGGLFCLHAGLDDVRQRRAQVFDGGGRLDALRGQCGHAAQHLVQTQAGHFGGGQHHTETLGELREAHLAVVDGLKEFIADHCGVRRFQFVGVQHAGQHVGGSGSLRGSSARQFSGLLEQRQAGRHVLSALDPCTQHVIQTRVEIRVGGPHVAAHLQDRASSVPELGGGLVSQRSDLRQPLLKFGVLVDRFGCRQRRAAHHQGKPTHSQPSRASSRGDALEGIDGRAALGSHHAQLTGQHPEAVDDVAGQATRIDAAPDGVLLTGEALNLAVDLTKLRGGQVATAGHRLQTGGDPRTFGGIDGRCGPELGGIAPHARRGRVERRPHGSSLGPDPLEGVGVNGAQAARQAGQSSVQRLEVGCPGCGPGRRRAETALQGSELGTELRGVYVPALPLVVQGFQLGQECPISC
ncbi:hypothetical protein BOO71_0000736 [Deinococcus marmoris]|uniref:Uncharacterized protein n=1 Tax=Deinococcus marmoris TaxID=249408 RepID=A0A1U7P502_9DEIO|nr:hypothetical protein BOO71_0000736 [Deinococcus marmoris]